MLKDLLNKGKKKLRKLLDVLGNTIIYFVYYNIPINNNLVYVESQNGEALNGNLLRICEELNKNEYKNLKLIIKSNKEERNKIKSLIENYKLKNTKLVTSTVLGLCYMERAKYLLHDAGCQSRFVKREGQIFVNTWHGTPFKVMGKSIAAERHSLGSVQRNFFMSDYILFPNRYMQKLFLKDYMLENLWDGYSLLTGYPRNSIFFDIDRRQKIKGELELNGMQVFAYLPTHRGTLFAKKNKEQVEKVLEYLEEIDKKLDDKQVLIVKMHLYNKEKIDCSKYKHIIAFPEGYETYDVLNIADCLITDYSSVFFDFANTRKKIVLFAYDEEEYFSDRGVYFPFRELPFPKVKNIDELINELNTEKGYDDSDFIKRYCTYDSVDATEKFCKHVFLGQKVCIEEHCPKNDKENVLIYAGNLAKNGITASLINLLHTVDTDKRNYYITFYRSSVTTPEKTFLIPDNINFLPIATDPFFTLREKFAYKELLESDKKNKQLNKYLKRLYEREYIKQFWNVKFDYAINFDGYTKNALLLFSELNSKNTVYVHSDMMQEIKVKRNQSFAMLHYVYNKFDNVAIVSNAVIDSTAEIKGDKKSIKVCKNFMPFKRFIERSMLQIEFQKDTEVVCSNPDGVKGVLNSQGAKIITIGRFSKEKGHIRLLNSFNEYWLQNREAQLIILGGLGNLYTATVRHCKKLNCWRNVTIIKSVDNPMPILKKSDLFVLPSLYEGLPVVLLEATALGIPCISTNVTGSRELMQQYGGYLVDDSEVGLLNGLKAFDRGEVMPMSFDFEQYNKKCLEEFESLF